MAWWRASWLPPMVGGYDGLSRINRKGSGGMIALWFRVRIWLANALLDLAEAVAPKNVRSERERRRTLR